MKKVLLALLLSATLFSCDSIPIFGDTGEEVTQKCTELDIVKTCQVTQVYGVLADLQDRLNKNYVLDRITDEEFVSRTEKIQEAEDITDAIDAGIGGDLDSIQILIDQVLVILNRIEE